MIFVLICWINYAYITSTVVKPWGIFLRLFMWLTVETKWVLILLLANVSFRFSNIRRFLKSYITGLTIFYDFPWSSTECVCVCVSPRDCRVFQGSAPAVSSAGFHSLWTCKRECDTSLLILSLSAPAHTHISISLSDAFIMVMKQKNHCKLIWLAWDSEWRHYEIMTVSLHMTITHTLLSYFYSLFSVRLF